MDEVEMEALMKGTGPLVVDLLVMVAEDSYNMKSKKSLNKNHQFYN